MSEIKEGIVSKHVIESVQKRFKKLLTATELAIETLEDIYLGEEPNENDCESVKKISKKRMSERAEYTLRQVKTLRDEAIKGLK